MLSPHQQYARQHSVEAGAINNFALDVYARLSSGEGNLLLSPFSIHRAMGLAFAGAAGTTAEQMAHVLRWGIDKRGVLPLANATFGNDDTCHIVVANAAWAQCGWPFLQAYVNRIVGPYRSDFFELDFAYAAEPSRLAINRWIEERTAGKIHDLLPLGSVDQETRLVVTNAVYLDARWQETFSPSDTSDAPFHLASGGCVLVPMMHQTAEFAAVEEDRFVMVHLPYQGFGISMQIYLPNDQGDFRWLEQTFLRTGPDYWQREMSRHMVTLSLPRFRLKASLFLRQILSYMGMPDAFSRTEADFGGMVSRAGSQSDPGIFLSEVIHKTYIDVDEIGTRAAAATGTGLTGGAPSPPPPLVVNVDHSFLFTICANVPQYRAPTLLFMGRVMDPTT